MAENHIDIIQVATCFPVMHIAALGRGRNLELKGGVGDCLEISTITYLIQFSSISCFEPKKTNKQMRCPEISDLG